MVKFEKVRSTIKPASREIDEYSVYINENIKEIEVQTNENSTEKTKMYEYDQTVYNKDEYINEQAQSILDTQVALCEIYESLGGDK